MLESCLFIFQKIDSHAIANLDPIPLGQGQTTAAPSAVGRNAPIPPIERHAWARKWVGQRARRLLAVSCADRDGFVVPPEPDQGLARRTEGTKGLAVVEIGSDAAWGARGRICGQVAARSERQAHQTDRLLRLDRLRIQLSLSRRDCCLHPTGLQGRSLHVARSSCSSRRLASFIHSSPERKLDDSPGFTPEC